MEQKTEIKTKISSQVKEMKAHSIFKSITVMPTVWGIKDEDLVKMKKSPTKGSTSNSQSKGG